MLSPLRRRPRSTRGIALLLVLIVLLLVATLATEIALTARTHYQLSSHAMNDFLLRSTVDGRRHILLAALRYDDSLGDNVDTDEDDWSWHNHTTLSSWGEAGGTTAETAPESSEEAVAVRNYRNRDVKILAWCEDERGKLNLRGLLWEDDSPTFINTREALVRLIDVYRERWPELDVSDSDAREMVTALVDWLRDKEDTDENPLPPTKNRQGRLLSLEELLRVPGGKWSPELCYDVRDPRQAEEGDFSRRITDTSADDGAGSTTGDPEHERPNGVPGLFRHLTVWGEGTTGTQPKVNVNTAPEAVLLALLEPGQEDLAKAIVEARRQAADSGSSSSSDSSSVGIKQKQDLTKVEGMGDDLTRYPRLDFFAEVKSATFSLHVIATMTAGRTKGDEETGEEPKDIVSAYQYHEVVQRTQAGSVSLFAERRNDPILDAAE